MSTRYRNATLAGIVRTAFASPAVLRVHFLHLQPLPVKHFYREMYFCFQEAPARAARLQGKIVLRFLVSCHNFHSLVTSPAPFDIHVQVAPRADKSSPVGFSLAHIRRSPCNPRAKHFDPPLNVAPAKRGRGSRASRVVVIAPPRRQRHAELFLHYFPEIRRHLPPVGPQVRLLYGHP